MNAQIAPRAGRDNAPATQPRTDEGDRPGVEDGYSYEDRIRQFRSTRTGRYVPGPDGPKRKRRRRRKPTD